MGTVVFDLDGTLADTSGDLIAAANACFRDLGHGAVLDPLRDQAVAFRGGRAMLRLGAERLSLDAALAEEQFPRLIEHYSAAIAVHTRLYPGAEAAVRGLRAAGYRTAICTNKPEAQAVDLVAKLGIAPLFDALIAADTLPVRKPDPEPLRAAVSRAGGALEQSLLVGDTETDYHTARAACVPILLVTFGQEGAVASLVPDAWLPDYARLQDAVRTLIG